MSTFQRQTVICPTCQHSVDGNLLEGMRAEALPELLEAVRTRTLHLLRCPSCHEEFRVEKPFLVADLVSGYYLAVELPTRSWWAAQERQEEVFQRAFQAGPAIARSIGERVHYRRVVFGLEALREKLILRDAGLDDRTVEIVKHRSQLERGVSPSAELLRVQLVLPEGHLLLGRWNIDSASEGRNLPANAYPDGFITIPAAQVWNVMLEIVPDQTQWTVLNEPWFVDLHWSSCDPRPTTQ